MLKKMVKNYTMLLAQNVMESRISRGAQTQCIVWPLLSPTHRHGLRHTHTQTHML